MSAGYATSRKGRIDAGTLLKHLLLVAISATFLFPLVYMLANSLMGDREVMQTYNALSGNMVPGDAAGIGFKLIPDKVSFLQYYELLLGRPDYLRYFWNSIRMTVPITLGQIVIAMLAAYAFGKLRFPFRNKIFFVYIIVMMMPYQVTLVPNYIMLKRIDLLDTYWAVIFPGVFSAFGVFLLKQFISYIPSDYCEASRIDGAGFLQMLASVVAPQCKGALASLAILVFIDNWNMVEQPLIFLSNQAMHPLSVSLQNINTDDLGTAFACGVLYMAPALLVFFYGENYLIEGIQLSGLK